MSISFSQTNHRVSNLLVQLTQDFLLSVGFTVVALKTNVKKQQPNIIMYRDYKKKFSNQTIREEIVEELSERNV